LVSGKTGNQIDFSISDERVGVKEALSCDYDKDDSLSKELNQELINYFEKTLSSLEKK